MYNTLSCGYDILYNNWTFYTDRVTRGTYRGIRRNILQYNIPTDNVMCTYYCMGAHTSQHWSNESVDCVWWFQLRGETHNFISGYRRKSWNDIIISLSPFRPSRDYLFIFHRCLHKSIIWRRLFSLVDAFGCETVHYFD